MGRLGLHGRVRLRCPCGLLRFVDGDPEVRGEPFEPGSVALADRPELPGTLASVELPQDERGLDRRVRAVEARQFRAVRRVRDPHVEPGHPAERTAVRGGRQHHAVDGGLHPCQVDGERVGG